MRTEAARYLTWKAAHAVETQTPGGEELAYEAKIWCSEAAVKCVAEAMRVVGVSAYDEAGEYSSFGQLMTDALVLPIFDGGMLGLGGGRFSGFLRGRGMSLGGRVWGRWRRSDRQRKENLENLSTTKRVQNGYLSLYL